MQEQSEGSPRVRFVINELAIVEIGRRNANAVVVLGWAIDQINTRGVSGSITTKTRRVSEGTGVPESTVRRSLALLEEMGVLSRSVAQRETSLIAEANAYISVVGGANRGASGASLRREIGIDWFAESESFDARAVCLPPELASAPFGFLWCVFVEKRREAKQALSRKSAVEIREWCWEVGEQKARTVLTDRITQIDAAKISVQAGLFGGEGPIVPAPAAKRKRNTYSEEFEAWWTHYPRKSGKDVAFEEYRKAIRKLVKAVSVTYGAGKVAEIKTSKTAVAFLLSRVKAYANAKPEFKLNPARWISEGRYKDDESTWVAAPSGPVASEFRAFSER